MRSIWSGTISFGLVSIPINLLSAVKQTGIDFDLVHKDDFCPINYARVCRRTGKEIPYDEIARAFEYKKNQFVILDDTDFEAANIKKYKSIVVIGFLENNKIDKIYYEKPYYIRPQSGSERAYYLFLKVLKQSGKSAIGKFVLRNREHLATIEPSGNLLMLYQLRFNQEIREPDFDVPEAKLERKEIDLARSLVENLSEDIDIKNFRDTYTDELMNLIKQKARGEKIEVPEQARENKIPDLMKALEESLKNINADETKRVSKKKKATAVRRTES